jgi:hypothetical protein
LVIDRRSAIGWVTSVARRGSGIFESTTDNPSDDGPDFSANSGGPDDS